MQSEVILIFETVNLNAQKWKKIVMTCSILETNKRKSITAGGTRIKSCGLLLKKKNIEQKDPTGDRQIQN